MLIREVMAVRLVRVSPETPLKDVAHLLVLNRIGGMPVVDREGRVMGMVTESDLQPGTATKGGTPYRTAADVMTTPVISLSEDDTVTQAARLLLHHRIKRAPVLRGDRLIGLVTRGDLLRPYLRTDSEIRADVEQALYGDPLDIKRQEVRVDVTLGVVRLEGRANDQRQRILAAKLAGHVDGVIDVDNGLEVA